MTGRWFRMYDAVADDPKVQRLSDLAFRTWVNLLCLASRGEGVIGGDVADLSFCLRKTPERTRQLVNLLVAAGLLQECEGGWRPHAWDMLQYKSDVSSARVKRFRDRFRNADETAPEQSREEQNRSEQIRSELHAPDPPPADAAETHTDFGEGGEEEKAAPRRSRSWRKTYPPEFEDFWSEYPVDPIMSKIRAFERWRALSQEDRAAARAALPAFRAHCARDVTYRVLHAERFLSQRRFDGFAEAPRSPGEIESKAARARWGGAAAPLVGEIGAPAFFAYFGEAGFEPGPPARILIAKPHLRDMAREKFAAALRRAFGEFVMEAPGPAPVKLSPPHAELLILSPPKDEAWKQAEADPHNAATPPQESPAP